MSSFVYIGNYPSHLKTEDLQNLFQDFVGASIVKSVKKDNKCYSFLSCLDEKQIQDIVESMNGIDVCGRSLIVRSNNKGDQKNSRNRTYKQIEDLKMPHPSSDSNGQFGKESSPNTSSLRPHSFRLEDNSWKNSDVARSHQPKDPQLGTLPKGNLDSKCYYSSASASKTPYLKFVNADSSLPSKEAEVLPKTNTKYHSSPDANKSPYTKFIDVVKATSPMQSEDYEILPETNTKCYFSPEANKTPYLKFINAVKATSPLQCKDSEILQEANSKYNSKSEANNINKPSYSKFVNAIEVGASLQSKDSEILQGTISKYNSKSEANNVNKTPYSKFVNAVEAGASLQSKDSDILQEANSKYNSKSEANNVNKTLYSKFVNAVEAGASLQSKDSEILPKTYTNKYHFSPQAFNVNNSPYSEVPARQNTSLSRNFKGVPSVPYNNHQSRMLKKEISHFSVYSNTSTPGTDANNDVFDDLTSSDQLFYVSVHNFPLYTGYADLLQLFADHNPVHVHMICNLPRVDHKPTEAIVAFLREDDAFNAVITLDNAVYNGRIILVAEVTDVSLLSELCYVGSRKST